MGYKGRPPVGVEGKARPQRTVPESYRFYLMAASYACNFVHAVKVLYILFRFATAVVPISHRQQSVGMPCRLLRVIAMYI